MSVTPLDGFVLNGSEYEMRDKLAQARIDNLAAQNNPTDGNTELLDIRVGADGHTYDSAGQAVREQILQEDKKVNRLSSILKAGVTDNLIDTTQIEDGYKYLVANGELKRYSDSSYFNFVMV